MKKYKFFAILNAFAVALAVQNLEWACFWFVYQPRVPEELAKFKK
ncbi:MAG TPA: cyclic lactone autoinducer peptide [Lachnospiraceae bacterium]|nr:cyclic lactone autoinducer peptide [Lachnospiraceae bacterium]